MYDAKVVGSKIHQARRSQNMTQQRLAQLTDIDRSYLGRIERGEVNITLKLLYRLAHTFGCSVITLIMDQAESESNQADT